MTDVYKRQEQRDAGPGESEYRDRDELVVKRTDAQQACDGGPEQHARGVGLLGVQVHA